MSVADVDGDKINEIVLLSEDEIKILTWDGFGFVERLTTKYVDTSQLQRNQRDIRTLFALDSDGDDCDEIFVSVPDKETTVWKLEKDSLVKIQSLQPTLLLNQKDIMIFGSLKQNKNYFSGQVTYKISKTDSSRTDQILPADYYSIGISDINSADGKEWITVDTENIMNVYTENMDPLWKSTMNFGSGIAIADLDKNNINEIIITSAIPQGKEDCLIILEWDGNTYAKKWESKAINGSITAICVGDPNNDGVDELITAIYNQGKSEILFYTANYIYR
jgi:hypothetical protein